MISFLDWVQDIKISSWDLSANNENSVGYNQQIKYKDY